ILAKTEGQWPGAKLSVGDQTKNSALECAVFSEQPLEMIELIVNGAVAQRFEPQNTRARAGSFESRVSTRFNPKTSSWLAWRCFEKGPGNRFRFAHTGPWHFDIPAK